MLKTVNRKEGRSAGPPGIGGEGYANYEAETLGLVLKNIDKILLIFLLCPPGVHCCTVNILYTVTHKPPLFTFSFLRTQIHTNITA